MLLKIIFFVVDQSHLTSALYWPYHIAIFSDIFKTNLFELIKNLC